MRPTTSNKQKSIGSVKMEANHFDILLIEDMLHLHFDILLIEDMHHLHF